MSRPEEAHLVEIFWSAQGEGLFVGASTVFIRFGGCDLRCSWCDSPETWRVGSECRIETEAGSQAFASLPNPVSLNAIVESIDALKPQNGSFVSLTGGEPLLQPAMALAVASASQERGLRTHLETHGLAVDALDTVLPAVDLVAMDWKLTTEVRPSAENPLKMTDFEDRHRAFLSQAASQTEVCVKVVLTPTTEDEELNRVFRAINEIAPEAPLILQPVTPTGGVKKPVAPARLMDILRRSEARVKNVRLIPQTHKMYGAL